MKPYDAEILVLGASLRYGSAAASLSVPVLTADKFIFGEGGGAGRDHAEVWQTIVDLSLAGKEPTFINVLDRLPAYKLLLQSLVGQLEFMFHVTAFNADEYLGWVNQVEKQGRVYQHGQAAAEQSEIIKDLETFSKVVEKIDDIDQWANTQLEKFRHSTSMVTGYTHVSSIVDEVQDRWKSILAGETAPMIDSGLPSLMHYKLFPRGKMAVIHGLSGSGKSSFVFQVLLGTALGLVRYNQPGCVAVNSLEMSQDDLVERMASILSGVDVSKLLNNTITPREVDDLFYWADVVKGLPIFVDQTNLLTTTAMQYRASGLHVSAHGPVVQIASDYGELFADVDDSEEQRINSVFRNQFRLARLLNASVLAISQSTNDKSTTGKTYICGPDGTRYSRGILQATDILVELWNPVQIAKSRPYIMAPDDMSLAHPYLLIQKYRGAAAGDALGLGWKAETTTFFDLAIDQEAGEETLFTHLEALGYGRGAW